MQKIKLSRNLESTKSNKNIFITQTNTNRSFSAFFADLIILDPLTILAQFYEFLDTADPKQLSNLVALSNYEEYAKTHFLNIPIFTIIKNRLDGSKPLEYIDKKFKEELQNFLIAEVTNYFQAINEDELVDKLSELILRYINDPLFSSKSHPMIDLILETLLKEASKKISLENTFKRIQNELDLSFIEIKQRWNKKHLEELKQQWVDRFQDLLSLQKEYEKLQDSSFQYLLVSTNNKEKENESHLKSSYSYTSLRTFISENNIVRCKDLHSGNESICKTPSKLKMKEKIENENIVPVKNHYLCLFTKKRDDSLCVYKIFRFKDDEIISFDKFNLTEAKAKINKKKVILHNDNSDHFDHINNPFAQIENELKNLQKFKVILANAINTLEAEIKRLNKIAKDKFYLEFKPELAEQKARGLTQLKIHCVKFHNKAETLTDKKNPYVEYRALINNLKQEFKTNINGWKDINKPVISEHRISEPLRWLSSKFTNQDQTTTKSQDSNKELFNELSVAAS